MRSILFVTLLILFSNRIFADGAPMDSTGKIYTTYVSITLDSIQIEHLQRNRYLELTPAQHKRLYFLDLPKYVDIVDPFHTVCTCGQIYGMWYATDKVAFAVEDTTKIEKHDSLDMFFDAYNIEYDTSYKVDEFYIGIKGQIYYKGQLVQLGDIPKILKTFEKEWPHVIVSVPPTTNSRYEEAILKTRKQIQKVVPEEYKLFWD